MVAPTAMTPSQLAGEKFAMAAPLLPALATTVAPTARASSIAPCESGLQAPALSRLTFTTFAGFALGGTPGTAWPAAQRMPSAMSDS